MGNILTQDLSSLRRQRPPPSFPNRKKNWYLDFFFKEEEENGEETPGEAVQSKICPPRVAGYSLGVVGGKRQWTVWVDFVIVVSSQLKLSSVFYSERSQRPACKH